MGSEPQVSQAVMSFTHNEPEHQKAWMVRDEVAIFLLIEAS